MFLAIHSLKSAEQMETAYLPANTVVVLSATQSSKSTEQIEQTYGSTAGSLIADLPP
eukprot:SAG22_NODE_1715_length_3747_cov_2.226700_4_plen_57_part_00